MAAEESVRARQASWATLKSPALKEFAIKKRRIVLASTRTPRPSKVFKVLNARPFIINLNL